MRVLLIAPPGAGKGTQAERIASRYDVVHISSGELLRAEVQRGSEVGRQIEASVSRGDLVPDDVVLTAVGDAVVKAAATGGYVLDGFPRTVEQAEHARALAAELGVEVQVALAFEVPHDELLRRMLARAADQGRADDTEDVCRHRLEVFEQSTRPLVEYYRSQGVLEEIDGSGTADEVSERIFGVLDGRR